MKRALKKTLKPIYFENETYFRRCDMPECKDRGEFRAPQDRSLSSYYWFCLDHVRAYNAAWDFYKGMSTAEIENHQHRDLTWQRPSWPFHPSHEAKVRRQFQVFEGQGRSVQTTQEERLPFPPTSAEARALAFFDLGYPFEVEELRGIFKKLVKQHHPDIHGGSEEAQEKLKIINEHYHVLMKIKP